jgi:hypothetical protein
LDEGFFDWKICQGGIYSMGIVSTKFVINDDLENNDQEVTTSVQV